MLHYKEMMLWIVLVAVFSPLAFLLMPIVVILTVIGGLMLFVGRTLTNMHLFRHF